jgi:periplasmic copper chaperone A
MKQLLFALLFAASGSLSAAGTDTGPVVKHAWVREAPPGASMMAAYLEIDNPGDRDMALVAVESPAFAHVMLHRSVTVDGVARMLHQDSIPVPAHGSLILEPGGYHLMMPAPDTRLVAGDKVEFVLRFADDSRVQVTAEVRKKP